MVSSNTSSGKVDKTQPAALLQTQALPVQQTGERTANTAQVAAMAVATAASPQLGRSQGQLPAQDALGTQTYAQLPLGVATHLQPTAALPPADQAVSPQAAAGDQTSSPQQALPAVNLINQADLADSDLGVQTQGGPELPVPTSSAIDSMPGVAGEPTRAHADSSTCAAQLPGTAHLAATQPGTTLPSGLSVKREDMPDAGVNLVGGQPSAAHQTAAQTGPAPQDEQHQSVPATEAAAAAGGMVDTEPATSAAQTDALVKAEPEPDTSMEDANKRSAADIFEQTVMECKKVVSEASSVLLNKEAAGAGGRRTSRIAASERATMWHNELQGLLNRCKMPQLYIGVLGDTGGRVFHHHAS